MTKTFRRVLALLGAVAAVLLPFGSTAWAQNAPAPLAVPGEIVLKAPAGANDADVRALADAAGCQVVGPIAFSPGYYLLTLKTRARAATTRATIAPPAQDVQNAVATLAATPGALASPNWLHKRAQAPPTQPGATPNDPLVAQQWHLRQIRMPEAWSIQVGARPVTVAVIDTGLGITHPDWRRQDGTPNYVNPVNVSNPTVPTTDVTDTSGHGTHVAGTIAAVANNGVGVASVAGWNQGGVDIKVIPIKGIIVVITNNIPEEFFSSASIIAGINYAVQQRAGVLNMSLGALFGPGNLPPYAQAVADAQRQGLVIVAATGNEGIDTTTLAHYPSDLPGVIAVSAVGPARTRASYSNFGGNVTIAAPGGSGPGTPLTEQVLSTWPPGVASPAGYPAQPAAGYQGISGTSMASPHVAGVVALLLAAGAEPGEIRGAIQSTAQRLDEVPNPAGGPGSQYGAGLIDAFEALLPFTGPRVRIVAPSSLTTTFLGETTISLQVRNVRRLIESPSAALTVLVRTATVPSTTVQTIPVDKNTLPLPPPGSSPATPVPVTLPAVNLPANEYVIEAQITGIPRPQMDRVFLNVASRVQPVGKSLFSVPYVLPGGAEAGLFGGASYALYRWDPSRGDYARFLSSGTSQEAAASFRATGAGAAALVYEATDPLRSSIAPVGLGYWLDLGSNVTLNISGRPVTNPVAIRLFAANGGWNMIGAPFIFPVAWNAVTVLQGDRVYSLQQAIDAGILRSFLVGYSRGDYVFSVAPQGQLVPWNGYWVRALQDCVLVIPPTPSAAQSTARALPPRAAENGWRVRLSASVAGDRDGQNYFGLAEGARAGEDRFDIAKPPSGAGHAYVRFLQNNDAGRSAAYASDMRPPGAARQEWTAAVTTDRENAEVTLSWDGLGGVSRRSRFTLTDTVTGKKVSLRAQSSYTFRSGEPGATRLFKIALEPEAITNVDMRRDDGSPVPAGPYLVEITARTTDGQVALVKRPLMKID